MAKKNTQTVLRWDLLRTAIINQIIIVFVVFLTISLLLSSFVVSEIRRNSANIVSAINLNVEEIFTRSVESLDEVYHLYVQENPEDSSHRRRIFNIFRNSDNTIEGIMILDGKGILVDGGAEETLQKGLDYSSQIFVKSIPKSGDTYWTGVSIAQNTGLPTAYVSKRFDKYIVVIRLNLKDITGFVERFKLSDKSEIAITDANGIYLINNHSALVKSRSYDQYIRSDSHKLITKYQNRYYLPYVSEIQGQGWKIIVYQSLSDYLLPTALMLVSILAVSVFLIFFVNWLNYRSLKVITRDLNLLEQQALEISKGDYEIEPLTSKYLEIEMLSQSFRILIDNIRLREHDIEDQNTHILRLNEGLEKQVRYRTTQLESTNGELTEAYKNLKDAQNLIVQNEKLAALGQMVSGVAHEMNTPIGNAFTASTYIRGVSKELGVKVQDNTIKRTEFLEMVSELENGADIVFRNLHIASDLIFNFKQISADHQNMELRNFNLYEIIKNVIVSFGIDLRNANVTLEFLCKENVMIKSYPGAVVHIVSNLIRNALVHGFEGLKKGQIRIEVFEFEDSISIMIQDDGIGMDQNTLNQIYDPFFTTKRSRGGTGLGLNIVHNMITNVLQGSVVCESVLGKGTQFTIQMPKQIGRDTIESGWTDNSTLQ